MSRHAVLFLLVLVASGCASLFGWQIHAPGLLSEDFAREIPRRKERVALYIPPDMRSDVSTDKGTRWSDPQTYHVGEAFVPMLMEAFQHGFEEFVLMEAVPTADVMTRYGIAYLVVVEIQGFRNRKDWGAQGLDLKTETTLFHPDLSLAVRFRSHGASDAPKVFAKKGGPEVNLNHAMESNLRAMLAFLQDWMASQSAQTWGPWVSPKVTVTKGDRQ